MKLNLVDLYGTLRQAPRISEDRNKATCILRVARNMIRNGGQNKERNGFWDEVIIRTKDKAIVDELAKMEQYDIVRVKGVITVRRINRQTICEHCGIKNITENKICYVELIYVERTHTGFTEDAAEDFVFRHREVSNIARIIGDLTGPPKANDKLSIPACQYQIAVPRTYRIEGDTDDEKADFPLVKSYGKNAKEDLKRLKANSSVWIDGCIQSRLVKQEFVCTDCGKTYKKEIKVNEIVPYETEYLKNYWTDEELQSGQGAIE